jgi:hypothetical protein
MAARITHDLAINAAHADNLQQTNALITREGAGSVKQAVFGPGWLGQLIPID